MSIEQQNAVNVLPRIPSELLIIARNDLKRAMDDDRFRVDFTTWFTPALNGRASGQRVCSVCAAGAVMAMSLGAPTFKQLYPSHFPENIDQLKAIDFMRIGEPRKALAHLGISRLALPDGVHARFTELTGEIRWDRLDDQIAAWKEVGL